MKKISLLIMLVCSAHSVTAINPGLLAFICYKERQAAVREKQRKAYHRHKDEVAEKNKSTTTQNTRPPMPRR